MENFRRGDQALSISGDSEQGLIPTNQVFFCSKEIRLNFLN
jgi:hypothetical protein